MAPLDPREARAVFLRSFKQLAPYKHRYEVPANADQSTRLHVSAFECGFSVAVLTWC